ncbi:MBL fold metallo-hydrolase [Lapidilactobacillus mulanensis]|uniref:MBL fold metallo-hydrolase n=1 Tax=Lapidilactobacillus mulanensis TaxID=2485999 RepID=A0ABW4DQL5_9LACO|nr:MBL fold metallo-hydrolase [Lapidilactobacillus mulanensis]
MTTLRFLNGLNTIGGNIVEFVNGDSRVIMDFGIASNFDDKTIQQAIDDHDLPHLPDLLLPDQAQKFAHQAIFISHLHIDHMGALKYLQAHEIPIYLSSDAKKLYEVLIAEGVEAPVENLHALADQEKIQVGSLSVTGFLSDHDTIGPMAFLVDDDEHKFLHSGDVRINGPHQDRVTRWSDLVANKLLVYLSEATTYSFATEQPLVVANNTSEPVYQEQDLVPLLEEEMASIQSTLIINPYPRNVERLINFNSAALVANRPIVWEDNYAKIIRTFAPEATVYQVVATDQPATEFNLHWQDLMAELQQTPRKFVVQNSWQKHDRLTEFRDGVYLHFNGEPLGDYDPHFAELQKILATQKLDFVPMGASGHASKQDIFDLANKISARYTVPWHSFKPELLADQLKTTRSEAWLPELDLYYEFD